MRFLVGNVLVVDTLAVGIHLVRELGLRDTIVTLTGEQIAGGGAITGGRFKRERSILSRRMQAQSLREALVELHATLERVEKDALAATARTEKTLLARDAAREALAAAELQIAEHARGDAGARRGSRAGAYRRESRPRASATTCWPKPRPRASASREYGGEFPREAADEEERRKLESDLATARAEIARAETTQAEASAHAGEPARTAGRAHGRARRLAGAARHARPGPRARAARARVHARRDRVAARANAQRARARRGLAHRRRAISTRSWRRRAANARRSRTCRRSWNPTSAWRRTRSARRPPAAKRIARGWPRSKPSSACWSRSSRKTRPPTTNAATWKSVLRGEDDAVVDDLPRLREELARLAANVNLNAEAEREEVAERDAFLRAQIDDLARARETLLQSIREIEQQTQVIFNETFDKVAASFGRMYARLFPGGEARMWQTNPENLSETGIEIAVAPPGKKQMPLPMLSGGERAMTAGALILALIEVKPSPFYLLDEVDAAMDDTNVGRFLHAVRELSADSQMVLVTHNKLTMELADVLYGVTMREPGVSSIVSAELTSAPEAAIA